jgi:DNA recombination protein RmuC
LGNHARQIRAHVDQLGRKEYWKALPQDTVDFVVMFVPGEPMYAAAMARDPGLFEHAWDKKVIICSPTTLLGLAKAIAYGWRQERASRDARKVQEVATELYRRMVKLGNDVSGMTKSLESHVKKHNQFIGSLEGSVLPHARKMTDLSIGSEQEEIKELDPVESDVREPKEGRDMVFEDPRSLPNPSEIS